MTWPLAVDGEGWMRRTERRVAILERKPAGGNGLNTLTVEDTSTLNLTLEGSSTDGYTLKGDVTGGTGGGGSGGTTISREIGEIFAWGSASTPSGTLPCDGRILTQASYPDLYAKIGTTFNTGGETTGQFRLPNLSGRVPVGQDATDTAFDVLGEKGGEKAHTLTVAEMPSHTHTQNPHTHTITFGGNAPQSIQMQSLAQSGTNRYQYASGVSDWANSSTTATNQNTGGDGAHNNLQPYLTLRWLIKVAYTGQEVPAQPTITGISFVGTIMEWPLATAPDGFLVCDGTAVSRTAYADLFAVIGTTFGVGDGSTTFNLPNKKGKVGVGLDTAQAEFDVMGETGGEKSHTLTVNEMPSHAHKTGISTSISYGAGPAGSATAQVSFSQNVTDTGLTGGGAAHNVLQPYIVVNFIIRYSGLMPSVTPVNSTARLIGEIFAWGGPTAPAGTLECDGSVQVRAAYPDLFAVLGTTYNTGGETTAQFRMPDLRGRTIVGLDPADPTFDALTDKGGAKTHTLSVAELAGHVHFQTVSFDGTQVFARVYSAVPAPGGGGSASQVFTITTAGGRGLLSAGSGTGTTRLDTTETATAPGAGGGAGAATAAHNNLQPYQVLRYVIKATYTAHEVPPPVLTVTDTASVDLTVTAGANGSYSLKADVKPGGHTHPASEVTGTIAPTQLPWGQRGPVQWGTPTLQGAWLDYRGAHHRAGYYRTSAGIVVLTGLIKAGAVGTTIMQLPVGYRPGERWVFPVITNTGLGRVDILPDGTVQHAQIGGNGWLSLEGIMFPAGDAVSAWTTITPAAGWVSYHTIDVNYPVVAYWRDSLGRVWMRGLIRETTPRTLTGATPMFNLPFASHGYSTHHPTVANNAFGTLLRIANGANAVTMQAIQGTQTNWVSLARATFVDAGMRNDWQPVEGNTEGLMLSGWINYTVAGYAPASWMTFDDGIVMRDGLISNGTVSGSAGGVSTIVPEFAGPDVHLQPSPWGSGKMINLVAANLAPERTDLARWIASFGAEVAITEMTGSASWRSHAGINYLMGS